MARTPRLRQPCSRRDAAVSCVTPLVAGILVGSMQLQQDNLIQMPGAPVPPRRQPQRALGMRTARTIFALLLREMSMSNGRTILGYLWEIVEPVVGILVLMFIFSLIMRSPAIGNNFALFYASGLLPFFMFTDISTKVAIAVRSARPLLTYPGVTYIDVIAARFLLASMTKLIIYSIVMMGILLIYDINPLFKYDYLLLGLCMALLMGLSVGVLNCTLFHFFPIWDRVWSLISRPLLILSGVIILPESVPLPYREWLSWNPLVHIIATVRMGIYATYQPGYVSVVYVLGICAILLPTALFLMRRYWRMLIDTTA
ncbi:MAG: ABC transporter permease [Gemmobacter sp.]